MSDSLINWEKLKPYDRSQYRSFEEFCYQVATTLHEHEGRFTPIDDSGGGDGVEFYLTFPNGDQWGWQAKFYYPEDRLTDSRRASIKDSLQRACDIHPNLKRWFLCTPGKLTPDEQKWFDEDLKSAINKGRPVVPAGHPVQQDNWTESDFIGWMSEERFAGIKRNFFGELELTAEWFRRQFEKQLEGVGDKFIASLHTETDEEKRVHQLLGDDRFAEILGELLAALNELYEEHRKEASELRKSKLRLSDWENHKSVLLASAESLQNLLGEMLARLNDARTQLERHDWEAVRDYDWSPLLDGMENALNEYRNTAGAVNAEELVYLGGETDRERENSERRERRNADNVISGPDWSAANFMDQARFLSQRFALLKEADLHIFGGAGFGKTHLCCHVCEDRLDKGLPALLILGAHFTTGEPLEKQLLSILDIPATYSWNDFLQALSSVARAHHTRIPIMIDGLNEATVGGMFSDVWHRGLPGLIRELSSVGSVVLVTTCRDSYREQIWEDKKPNLAFAQGFPQSVTREAVERYFAAYKIEADLTAAPLGQFQHPIYLRIFCEITNPDAETPLHIYVGEQSLFETFEKYLEHCNTALCKRLGLRRRIQIVAPTLDKLAIYMWTERVRRVSLNQAAMLIDGKAIEEVPWDSSRMHALESEGLLVCRDWGEAGEELFFTYDLLGGYLIARSLIRQHAEDLTAFFNAESTVEALFSEDSSTRHPMYEDISRALAALLPQLTSQYLHNLTDNRVAFSRSINALFEIAPRHVNQESLEVVTKLFGKPENRRIFFQRAASTTAHAHHPLNVEFWHERLRELPMAERDLSWSEYVREHTEEFEEFCSEFETRFHEAGEFTREGDARLALLARHLMWLLTSNVRILRDKATRAMYWYGRRKPREFFGLLEESFDINDPYVSERMLAAAYGIAMARQSDFNDLSFTREELPRWARALYDMMFAPSASKATTHILARDYARRTIEIALIHHQGLLDAEEQERITPPYSLEGLREWGESEDRDKGNYREGNAPLGMDFENYTIGRLAEDRRNYDYEHEGFKRVRANVLWRIYDLGYSLERFGQIDQWIARGSWDRDRNPGRTDRYGKKYSWIAFFELAGSLLDQELLPDRFDDVRLSDADIDPSFPEKLPDHKQVDVNSLGTDETTTQEWIRDGGLPDVAPYLIVNNLRGEPGEWVLIDAHINQESSELDRNRFIFIRTLIIKEEEAEEITELLVNQDMKNRWLPEVPESHYMYAGEIPWCETFPENEWSELEFTTDDEEEEGELDAAAAGDESEGEASAAGREDETFDEDGGDLDEATEDKPHADRRIQFWAVSVPTEDNSQEERGLIITYSDPGDDKEKLEAAIKRAEDILAKEGREAFEKAIKECNPDGRVIWAGKNLDQQQLDEQQGPKFYALVPLREYSWESYHSALNEAGGAEVLAKQVAEALDLRSQPQTFDLFSADGMRATIAWRHDEEERNSERFLYLRRDLLKEFLKKQNRKLVWVTWGERQHSVAMMSNLSPAYRPGHGEKPWRVFQQVTPYDDFNAS